MSFDYQPVLKGNLVHIRPLRFGDYDDLFAVAADPVIWEQHPVKNRYEEFVFQTFFRESLASGGALLVLDASSDRAIGSYRFHGYSREDSEVEIGWTFLARSYWGGKCNGEVIELMLRHAFKFVNSVVYLVAPTNVRSQRSIEKIGGTRVASRPDASGLESYVYQIEASTPRPKV